MLSHSKATKAATNPAKHPEPTTTTVDAPAVGTVDGRELVGEPDPVPLPAAPVPVGLPPPPALVPVPVAPPHSAPPPTGTVAGWALRQLHTAPTAPTTLSAWSPHAPTTHPTAACWIAADDVHWQPRSPARQPTALAADAMQLVAHAGTAEIGPAHGLAEVMPPVPVHVDGVALGVVVGLAEPDSDEQDEEDEGEELPLPLVLEGDESVASELPAGGLMAEEEVGDGEAVVVTWVVGGGAAVDVAVGQETAGLAATHWQREPTAPRTAMALSPQAPTTHPTAVCWMASDLEHWQPRSP